MCAHEFPPPAGRPRRRLPTGQPRKSAMSHRSTTRRPAQRGISMIELMVSIVVAMLVGLAASSTAMVFTASQRQGIGIGGVAVNANTALAALKNDASTAGLGFFGDSRYLCASLNLSAGATASWDGASFAPVRLTTVSGNQQVDVLQSSRVESGATVLLKIDSTGTDAVLRSYLPAAVGDAVLLSPAAAGDPCLVRSVTSVVAATNTTPLTLGFAATGTHNAASFTTTPTYSENGAGVTLLGSLVWNRYLLSGTDLVLQRPLEGTQAVLARNVMAFRAQYGIANVGTTSLASWQDPTGATFGTLGAAGLPQVRAVRIGVVTRSPQREKANTAGVCEASSAKPRIFDVEVTPDVTDWQCYRYRTAVLVVPLRNLVLGQPIGGGS